MTYPHTRDPALSADVSVCRCGSVRRPAAGKLAPTTWGSRCPDAMADHIAELEATLANERGAGEPPSPGWRPCLNGDGPWEYVIASDDQGDPTDAIVVSGCPGVWSWERLKGGNRIARNDWDGPPLLTARAAMRDADDVREQG